MTPARFTALLVSHDELLRGRRMTSKVLSLDEPPTDAIDGAMLYQMFNGGA